MTWITRPYIGKSFKYLAEQAFERQKSGEIVFFPMGRFGKGRIVPDLKTKNRTVDYLTGIIGAAIITGVVFLVVQMYLIFFVGLLLFLLWYYWWIQALIKNWVVFTKKKSS